MQQFCQKILNRSNSNTDEKKENTALKENTQLQPNTIEIQNHLIYCLENPSINLFPAIARIGYSSIQNEKLLLMKELIQHSKSFIEEPVKDPPPFLSSLPSSLAQMILRSGNSNADGQNDDSDIDEQTQEEEDEDSQMNQEDDEEEYEDYEEDDIEDDEVEDDEQIEEEQGEQNQINQQNDEEVEDDEQYQEYEGDDFD